jgi:hypothetical protein
VGSPLYVDWFAPQGFHGVTAAPIMARNSLSGVVMAFCGKSREGFCRARRQPSCRLCAPSRARGVAAPRARAVSRRSVRASRQLLDDAEDAVLVLDGGLQVIDANAAAIVLLDDGERLRLRHRRLFAQHPDEDAKLQALLRLIVLKRENVE